jgi:protein-tyrosine phosphatase
MEGCKIEKIGTSDSHPIYVNFIPQDEIENLKGTLSLTFAPGKTQKGAISGITWQRNLTQDLERLKTEYQTTVLVTLIEKFEFSSLKIDNLRKEVFQLGMKSIWFPIKDGDVPDCGNETLAIYDIFISYLHSLLSAGENLVVHCMGGLGRAGTVTACILLKNGKNYEDALKIVRKTREGAIQTKIQEEFLLNYENYLSEFKTRY